MQGSAKAQNPLCKIFEAEMKSYATEDRGQVGTQKNQYLGKIAYALARAGNDETLAQFIYTFLDTRKETDGAFFGRMIRCAVRIFLDKSDALRNEFEEAYEKEMRKPKILGRGGPDPDKNVPTQNERAKYVRTLKAKAMDEFVHVDVTLSYKAHESLFKILIHREPSELRDALVEALIAHCNDNFAEFSEAVTKIKAIDENYCVYFEAIAPDKIAAMNAKATQARDTKALLAMLDALDKAESPATETVTESSQDNFKGKLAAVLTRTSSQTHSPAMRRSAVIVPSTRERNTKNSARKDFYTYIKGFSRPLHGVQRLFNISQSTMIHACFTLLASEKYQSSDYNLLLALQWFFEDHLSEGKAKRLKSSAFAGGRLLNVAALRYGAPDDELRLKVVATLEGKESSEEIEVALRTLDKEAFPKANREAMRRKHMQDYLVQIRAELAEHKASSAQTIHILKTLFMEGVDAKTEPLQDAAFGIIAEYESQSHAGGIAKRNKLADYVELYLAAGGQCRHLLETLIPDAVKAAGETQLTPPPRTLKQDLENIADSEFIAELKAFGKERIGSHFADIASALTTVNDQNEFLQCLHVIIEELLKHDFSPEKFASSAFIGRLINASSRLVLRDQDWVSYNNSKRLLAADKAFTSEQRRKFLMVLDKHVCSLLEEHGKQPLKSTSEIAKTIRVAVQKTSEKTPKFQQTVFVVLTEHLHAKRNINLDNIMAEARMRATEVRTPAFQRKRDEASGSDATIVKEMGLRNSRRGTPQTFTLEPASSDAEVDVMLGASVPSSTKRFSMGNLLKKK